MAATQLSLYQDAIRLFGDARLDLITDEVESRRALDDAWAGTVDFCLRAAPWRAFTKTTALLAGGATPLPGFSTAYTGPVDWLRTHALFQIVGSFERPVDIREQGGAWFANGGTIYIRFVSTNYRNPAITPWPEHFSKAVAAHLAFSVADRLTNSAAASVRMSQLYGALIQEAILHDALPEDPWLRHQLDGTFQEGVHYVLAQGAWRFALNVESLIETGGPPAPGFAIIYQRPASHLRTHGLFLLDGELERPVDIREYHDTFFANQPGVKIRYISANFADPIVGHWPEPFLVALLAYLQLGDVPDTRAGSEQQQAARPQSFRSILANALALEGEPEDDWYRYQQDGSFREGLLYLLEQGYWRFALKTIQLNAVGGPIPDVGFPYAYTQPPDWLRSHALFVPVGDGREHPVDIKEAGGQWSTTASVFVARYLSKTLGSDPLRWPEPFLAALLVWLRLRDEPADQPGAGQSQAVLSRFQRALETALATEAEPEDQWLRYQLNGSFHEGLLYFLVQGFWRFALTSVASTDLAPTPGEIYHFRIPKPADWLRTHQLFLSIDPGNFERPFDIREHHNHWASNKDDFVVRYISSNFGRDSSRWPETFLAALLAYLTPAPAVLRERQRSEAAAVQDLPFVGMLQAALAAEAEPEDQWLSYQLDGSFQEALHYVLAQGFWRFALNLVASVDLAPTTPGGIYRWRTPKPANWLRTHQLFISVDPGNFERPFDVRERHDHWSSNRNDFVVRYISSDFGFDQQRWPEPFLEVILAYLKFPPEPPEKPGQDQTGRFAVALAVALAIESEPEDQWLEYQLDGSFQEALHYVLAQGFWRFALISVASADLSPTTPGVIYRWRTPKPSDWLRTHQLFISVDPGNFERPFDIREHSNHWASNRNDFVVRYVSANFGFDPYLWPELFLTAVLAYLTAAPAESQSRNAPGTDATPFVGILANALAVEGEPEDQWLEYQLDGSFQEGLHYVLAQGYWSFTLKTVEFASAPITTPPATIPVIGYPYSFPQPSDMLRSHAFFVPAGDGREHPIDIKEDLDPVSWLARWSTNATQPDGRAYFAVRYVSSDLGFNPAFWPECLLETLHAYLELREAPDKPQQTSRTTGQPVPAIASYRNLLESSLAIEAEPENPWYRFQRTGAFLRACFHVAETGRWKFAIDTIDIEADAWVEQQDVLGGTLPANVYGDGSISPSYSAVFAKPADWLKTIWVYSRGWHGTSIVNSEMWPDRTPIDFRDEKGNWHANFRQIQVRYIRRAAIESWRWPQSYANAVLAWLEYDEVRTDPKLTQLATTKQRIYEDMVDKAAKSDDMAEFPPYRTVGHLVRGRFSRGWRHGGVDFGRF